MVTDPTLRTIAYLSIIATETAAALKCWVGVFRLVRFCRGSAGEFEAAKVVAACGITLSLVLWLGGFLTIGGAWRRCAGESLRT